jgi:hypothetical protein
VGVLIRWNARRVELRQFHSALCSDVGRSPRNDSTPLLGVYGVEPAKPLVIEAKLERKNHLLSVRWGRGAEPLVIQAKLEDKKIPPPRLGGGD